LGCRYYVCENMGGLALSLVCTRHLISKGRKVVGWSMANNLLKTDLVLDAVNMGIYNRRPAPGLIHHSERPWQPVHLGGVR